MQTPLELKELIHENFITSNAIVASRNVIEKMLQSLNSYTPGQCFIHKLAVKSLCPGCGVFLCPKCIHSVKCTCARRITYDSLLRSDLSKEVPIPRENELKSHIAKMKSEGENLFMTMYKCYSSLLTALKALQNELNFLLRIIDIHSIDYHVPHKYDGEGTKGTRESAQAYINNLFQIPKPDLNTKQSFLRQLQALKFKELSLMLSGAGYTFQKLVVSAWALHFDRAKYDDNANVSLMAIHRSSDGFFDLDTVKQYQTAVNELLDEEERYTKTERAKMPMTLRQDVDKTLARVRDNTSVKYRFPTSKELNQMKLERIGKLGHGASGSVRLEKGNAQSTQSFVSKQILESSLTTDDKFSLALDALGLLKEGQDMRGSLGSNEILSANPFSQQGKRRTPSSVTLTTALISRPEASRMSHPSKTAIASSGSVGAASSLGIKIRNLRKVTGSKKDILKTVTDFLSDEPGLMNEDESSDDIMGESNKMMGELPFRTHTLITRSSLKSPQVQSDILLRVPQVKPIDRRLIENFKKGHSSRVPGQQGGGAKRSVKEELALEYPVLRRFLDPDESSSSNEDILNVGSSMKNFHIGKKASKHNSDCSIGEFVAFDGVGEMACIKAIESKKLICPIPNVFMSEPIQLDNITLSGSNMFASVSHSGIFAASALVGEKYVLQLVDLKLNKSVTINGIDGFCQAAFYDSFIVLLIENKKLREAPLVSIWKNPKLETFDEISNSYPCCNWCDVTKVQMKRKIVYGTIRFNMCEYDVDKHNAQAINCLCEEMFSSTGIRQEGINYVYRYRDAIYEYRTNGYQRQKKLLGDCWWNCSAVIPSDLSKKTERSLVVVDGYFVCRGWGEPEPIAGPLTPGSILTIVRMYRNNFFVFDRTTSKWYAVKIVVH